MLAYHLTTGPAYSIDRTEHDLPRPQAGEVLVNIRAAALNYLDLMVAWGKFGAVPPNFIPGTDGAGVIAAVGEQVTDWQVGDAVVLGYMVDWTNGPVSKVGTARLRGVTMPGSLAEFVVVPASSLVRKPASLSFVEAATLPIAATTAWNAIVAANVRPGSTVALLGTGGVSLFALQFAKAAGARVIISSSSDEKLAKARALGADVTINYVNNPNWDEAVLEATGQHGADLVVETVGGSTFARSLNAAAYGGTVYVVGFIGGMDLTMPILPIMSKTLRIIGSQTGSTANLIDATKAISMAGIKPVIDRVFSFDEVMDAYAFLAKAGHFGKVAIRLDSDHDPARIAIPSSTSL